MADIMIEPVHSASSLTFEVELPMLDLRPSAPLGEVREVGGIQVRYTDLKQALETLSMTEQELKAVMQANDRWPYPASQDGTVLAHNAIRHNLEKLYAAFAKTKQQVDMGRPLHAWQCTNLSKVVRHFHKMVHWYSSAKEGVLFPWMSRLMGMPMQLSALHADLMADLNKMRDMCVAQLQPNMDISACQEAMDELCSTFTSFRSRMRRHLEEEELVGLPFLRKYYRAEEAKTAINKIADDMKPSQVAWLLRRLDHEGKVAVMTRFKASAIERKLVLLPAVAKDDRTIVRMTEELIAGPGGLPAAPKGKKGAL